MKYTPRNLAQEYEHKRDRLVSALSLKYRSLAVKDLNEVSLAFKKGELIREESYAHHDEDCSNVGRVAFGRQIAEDIGLNENNYAISSANYSYNCFGRTICLHMSHRIISLEDSELVKKLNKLNSKNFMDVLDTLFEPNLTYGIRQLRENKLKNLEFEGADEKMKTIFYMRASTEKQSHGQDKGRSEVYVSGVQVKLTPQQAFEIASPILWFTKTKYEEDGGRK